CHSCGAGGDAFSWLQKAEGMTFRQAAEELAHRAGVDWPPEPEAGGSPPAPEDPVEELARRRGWSPDAIRALGGEGDGKFVTWPMRDAAGERVGTKRRRGDNRPIRLASGAEVKSQSLDGNGLMYPDGLADLPDPVLVCEGEADAVAAISAGHRTVVATAGANPGTPSIEWIGELLSGRDIMLAPDPGTAGRRHRDKLANRLLDAQAVIRLVVPDGYHRDLDERLHRADDASATLARLISEAAPYEPPPAPDDDLDPDEPVATLLVQITLGQADPLFVTPEKEVFLRVPVGDHREILRLRDGRYREWVEAELYRRTGRAAYDGALSSARSILGGQARIDEETHELHNRVAWHRGRLWYDLADDDWRAVAVGPDGWDVVNNPPIIFRRHAHQLPQVEPRPGGDFHRLLEFVNVPQDHEMLLLVYALTCFVPGWPHPIPAFVGPAGSAKSTNARALRRVIDPSVVETLSFSRRHEEVVQQLHHHWFAIYDNVSSIPLWFSDLLCRASTGEGFSKRQLWTDDEDVFFSYRRCVGLTATSSPITQSDLFNRVLVFNIEQIDKGQRLREWQYWAAFEDARPEIVGAAFDVLSTAIRVEPTLSFDDLPRMADFAASGAAVAIGLGYTQEEWMETYWRHIAERHRDAIEASPFASAIAAMMEGRTAWRGTASQLLHDATEAAEREGIDTEARAWPGSAQWAANRLREAEVDLRDQGIDMQFDREGRDRRRVIWLTRQAADEAEDPFAPDQGDPFG
ncbi:MAG: CHC2 zinc finger domain-containing protein, partial [Planctomycetota bacterium]|nr:CHC2 zinc finger domain-containing protein [Planctomycetota bacterium]